MHTQRLARAIHRLIPDAIAISRINMPFRKKRCVRYHFFKILAFRIMKDGKSS